MATSHLQTSKCTLYDIYSNTVVVTNKTLYNKNKAQHVKEICNSVYLFIFGVGSPTYKQKSVLESK